VIFGWLQVLENHTSHSTCAIHLCLCCRFGDLVGQGLKILMEGEVGERHASVRSHRLLPAWRCVSRSVELLRSRWVLRREWYA